MSRFPLVAAVCAALLGAPLGMAALGMAAHAASAAEVDVDAALTEATHEAAVAKIGRYTGLMAETQRAAESWRRYQSWVSPTTGPTGRERAILGLYPVPTAGENLARAREAARQAPAFGTLDAAALRFVEAYETLAPLLNAAARYYENRDYLSDGMKEGRALHPGLSAAAAAFMSARAELEAMLRPVQTALDHQALTLLERREGRSPTWHVRSVMLEARTVMETLYGEASRGDLAALDGAIGRFETAVGTFAAFADQADVTLGAFEEMPQGLLDRLREYRRAVEDQSGSPDPGRIATQYELMLGAARPFTQARPRPTTAPG